MIKITVPEFEVYNSKTNEFTTIPPTDLYLEHSLIAISKWESLWNRSFLDDSKDKTAEEVLDYIRCMTINHAESIVYQGLTIENYNTINAYINAPMTATNIFNFSNNTGSHSRDIITSELIYFWMISFNIPMECEKWHINRLITLIRICQIKNEPEKKLSTSEVMARNRALNEARRAKLNSKG